MTCPPSPPDVGGHPDSATIVDRLHDQPVSRRRGVAAGATFGGCTRWSQMSASRAVTTAVIWLIGWQLAGPDHGVEVAVGPRPDLIDHSRAVIVPPGRRSLELDRPPSARLYVSVSPADGGSGLLAAERRVLLEGAVNFRDLGGYTTVDGRRTRWGCVFRSDAFHALTDEDRSRFSELGLRVIYDLRSDSERMSHPNVIPDDDTLRSVDLFLSAGDGRDGEPATARAVVGRVGVPARAVSRDGGEQCSRLRSAAVGSRRPGCVAGGVPLPLGKGPYGRRRRAAPQRPRRAPGRRGGRLHAHRAVPLTAGRPNGDRRLQVAGVPPEAAAGVASTAGWVIDAVLSEIVEQYGDIDGYLLGPAGMRRQALEDLRRLVLTS